jgi:hypothetical protein
MLSYACQVESTDQVGSALLELREVPADVHCIRIDVRAPSRSISQTFSVMPGTTATLSMPRLPLGDALFSGDAFLAACGAIASSNAGEWSSEPVSAHIEVSQVAHVMLVMKRNGRGEIEVSFEDDATKECAAPAPSRRCGNCGTQGVACNAATGEWEFTNVCEHQGECMAGDMLACSELVLGMKFCDPVLCAWSACSCPMPTVRCGTTCALLEDDPKNCGSCGRACNSAQLCTRGQCVCRSGALCNGACVDTATDEGNCGVCGNVCSAGQTCSAGRCS